MVSEYEGNDLLSCKDEIIQFVDHSLHACKEEVSGWDDSDTDYMRIAHTLILEKCQSVLCNRPCLALNQKAYYSVRREVLNWAIRKGFISEQERKEYE